MNFKTVVKVLVITALLACQSQKRSRYDSVCTLNFKLTKTGKQLVAGNWTETNITVLNWDENGDSHDVTGQFMVSDLDDVIIFKKDGTFAFDEGKSKATPESAQIYETGNWAFYEKEKKLVLCTEGHNTYYDLVSLSSEKLVLQLQRNKAGKKYTYILSYSPK